MIAGRGADIRYDMAVRETHQLVGRWAPDLLLTTDNGQVRLAALTTTARPQLLDLTEDASLATAADRWLDRVDTVTAHTQDTSTTGLLLRPDCYVAGPPTRLALITTTGNPCVPR